MSDKERKIEKRYTDSLFYEIHLTGKYIKKMGEQHFKNLNLKLTCEEFSVLDFIYENDSTCQRDLALKMLINRANMGKILNGLEEKGYIKRTLDTRCNYPVKLVNLTGNGEEIYLKTIEKLRETTKSVIDKITKEESEKIIVSLKKLRGIVKELVEIDI